VNEHRNERPRVLVNLFLRIVDVSHCEVKHFDNARRWCRLTCVSLRTARNQLKDEKKRSFMRSLPCAHDRVEMMQNQTVRGIIKDDKERRQCGLHETFLINGAYHLQCHTLCDSHFATITSTTCAGKCANRRSTILRTRIRRDSSPERAGGEREAEGELGARRMVAALVEL
jgi:hypothetical protein